MAQACQVRQCGAGVCALRPSALNVRCIVWSVDNLVAGVVGIGEVWEVRVLIVYVLTVCEGGGHR